MADWCHHLILPPQISHGYVEWLMDILLIIIPHGAGILMLQAQGKTDLPPQRRLQPADFTRTYSVCNR